MITLLRRAAPFQRLDRPAILPLLFVLLALPTCVFLALAVPPGEVPDEPAHVARAGSLLHGALFGQRRPSTDGAGQPIAGAGVTTNPGPVFAAFGVSDLPPPERKMTKAQQDRLQAIPWGATPMYFGVPNTAVYFPVFYVPAAIGLGAGHVLRMAPVQAVLLARAVNVVAYVLVGALALLLARRGRWLLFATLLLPMSLWLAASCNQDGLLVATTCLAVALLTMAERPGGAAYWAAGALLACIIAVKFPYFPIAAAMLLPCRWSRREQRGPAVAGVALAFVPGLLWTLAMVVFVAAPFVFGPPYPAGPLWPGDPARMFPATDPAAQMQVFLHNPLRVLVMPVQKLLVEGHWKLNEMIGVLGPLTIVMPGPVYVMWFAALGAAAACGVPRARLDAPGPSPLVVAAGLVVAAVTVLSLYDFQYLSWTTVGKAEIDGVQGRYFLPLLATLALIVPSVAVPGSAGLRRVLAMPAIGAACFGAVYLPLLVVQTFYVK